MADFCKQCSIDMFGEDFEELANLMPADQYTDHVGALALCEGCGLIVVSIDGTCLSLDCIEKHGAQTEYESWLK